MKGNAAMMGAAVVIAAAVAMVLSLVLVLFAELYCTLLHRKRRRHPNTDSPTSAATSNVGATPSLCSFYAQGVIRAPRSFLFPAPPPPENHRFHLRHSSYQDSASPDSAATSADHVDQLVYICNPMYDDGETIKIETPFETPGTSPSHFDIESGSSSGGGSSPATLPLTPMKKIPAEGASVSLKDGRSNCTTPSDSNTNDCGISSSSSASPSTSPSW